ncbi:hypothetical protein B0H13DRAFT_1853175 [Mycena leptocephala]|nr:hypothetical protein B0H13DRAFT_1853175 [Mycena leptocephala]
MSGVQMANASPAEIASGLITFLGEVSEEEGVKVLAALLSMQLVHDNRGISGEEILYHTSGTAMEDIRFRRPEGPRRGTATIPDRPGSPDTQDGVRIAEDLIVNPEWQRDQDLIDNLESELHQALSRIEEYEAQLQTMHKNWKKELERLRAERAERETELTTQKKTFEEIIQDLEAESANIRSHYQELQRRASESDTYTKQKDAELETVKSQYEDATNECQRLKLELEKVQTNPNIHDTFEASTADLRFHQEGHWLHDDVMINLADNDRTKIWSGGAKAQRTLWAKRTSTLMANGLSAGQEPRVYWAERAVKLGSNAPTHKENGEELSPYFANSCNYVQVRPSSRASLSWSVITEAPNMSNLAYVHHTGRFHGVHTVEITGEKLATPQGRFQLYRIFQKNVGALIVLARYGINKPDAYVDIRGKDKRILGKVIQDSSAPTKAE